MVRVQLSDDGMSYQEKLWGRRPSSLHNDQVQAGERGGDWPTDSLQRGPRRLGQQLGALKVGSQQEAEVGSPIQNPHSIHEPQAMCPSWGDDGDHMLGYPHPSRLLRLRESHEFPESTRGHGPRFMLVLSNDVDLPIVRGIHLFAWGNAGSYSLVETTYCCCLSGAPRRHNSALSWSHERNMRDSTVKGR